MLVGGELFLAPDDVVLDIDVPCTALVATVGVMSAFGYTVPGPLLPVEVLEALLSDR